MQARVALPWYDMLCSSATDSNARTTVVPTAIIRPPARRVWLILVAATCGIRLFNYKHNCELRIDIRFAPYCGTGHKTTFGLGQTRSGWLAEQKAAVAEQLLADTLAQRIEELTKIFTAQRKRKGGDRTDRIAVTWATVLARREHGGSLAAIALDLEMKPETVKTYVKLARKALKGTDEGAIENHQ